MSNIFLKERYKLSQPIAEFMLSAIGEKFGYHCTPTPFDSDLDKKIGIDFYCCAISKVIPDCQSVACRVKFNTEDKAHNNGNGFTNFEIRCNNTPGGNEYLKYKKAIEYGTDYPTAYYKINTRLDKNGKIHFVNCFATYTKNIIDAINTGNGVYRKINDIEGFYTVESTLVQFFPVIFDDDFHNRFFNFANCNR